jgi:phosphoribosylformylglycinamidine synthase
LLVSAHDISDGGLFTTLAESSFVNKLGFKLTSDDSVRTDAFLFGEAQGRVVVSVSPEKEEEFVEFMALTDVPFSLIGSVTTSEVIVDEVSWGHMEEFELGYQNSLSDIMD